MSTDWTTEPAGAALDRHIAELLGWTDVKEMGEGLVGTRPDGTTWMLVPRYSADLRDTLTLPLRNEAKLEITIYGDGSVGVDLTPNSGGRYHEGADDVTGLALAACRAWERWYVARQVAT